MTAPQSSIPTRAECLAAAGDVLAAARATRDEAYQQGGALEVARQAHVPGGKSAEELAEGYERLAQQARKAQHSVPLTSQQDIVQRGIQDSLERGKKPGPDVEQRVVAFAAPHLTERGSGEPLDAA